MFGGTGADTFYFDLELDSKSSAPDVIVDFKSVDRIGTNYDASMFELDTGGSFLEGEIRQTIMGSDVKLEFNLDSDSGAEFVVIVRDHGKFTSVDDLLV